MTPDSSYQAILFDLDGTLANTDPIHLAIWAELLKPYGYQVDKDFYQQRISGRLNLDIVQDLLPHLSPAAESEFSAYKEMRFRQAAFTQLQPLPGLIPLLDWADRQRLSMAVVTNAPRDNAEFMLETLGLSDRFDPVILAGELARGKPDPLPYQEALKQLMLTADDALVFEDSTTGVQAAVAAGLTTIGVASTHAPETLTAIGAVCAILDFRDDRLRKFGLGEIPKLPSRNTHGDAF